MSKMTCAITNGIDTGTIQTVDQYLEVCLRTFNLDPHMRDDPFDKPYPEVLKPDQTYRVEEIESIQSKIDQLNAMLDKFNSNRSEFDSILWSVHREAEKSDKKALDEYTKEVELLNKYRSFEKALEDWEVPEKLESLREFALRYLHDLEPTPNKPVPSPLNGISAEDYAAHLKERIKDLEEDLQYHRRKMEDEQMRYDESNAYLQLARSYIKKGFIDTDKEDDTDDE